jgi:hypothetical protein
MFEWIVGVAAWIVFVTVVLMFLEGAARSSK